MRLDSLRSRLVMRLDPLCSTMRLLLSCTVFCSIPLLSSVFVAFCCCYFAKIIRNAFSCDRIDSFCRIVSSPGLDDDVVDDDDDGATEVQTNFASSQNYSTINNTE